MRLEETDKPISFLPIRGNTLFPMPGMKVHTDEEALALRQIEAVRAHLHARLRQHFGNNMKKAADAIQLSPSSFYRHFPQSESVVNTTSEVPIRILVIVANYLHDNSGGADLKFAEMWDRVTADVK